MKKKTFPFWDHLPRFNCVTLYSVFLPPAAPTLKRDAEFSHSFGLRQLKLNPIRDVCSLKIVK